MFRTATHRPRRVTRALLVALAAVALLAGGAPAEARPAPAHPKPAFAWRGIIEGFYGTPWDHADRMRVITWMGAHGFNAYIRAPKGDGLQTSGWRQPYPSALQRRFAREIADAAALKVQWIPNLSPARGPVDAPERICFTCPQDLDALQAKLEPFVAAGARAVMVSFDDITAQLGPADSAVYEPRFPGTPPEYQFGRATVDLLNGLRARLPRAVRLLTVLPDYSGTLDTPFLAATRDGALDPAIGVMWTGPNIRATNFAPSDAAAYAGLIGRTPIVWENWVTRDFVPTRLYLGPYRKQPELVGAVQGFFFNAMNEPDLNMLPLATAGDWMRDPAHYDADASWRKAVTELSLGREPLEEQLRAWAETSYSSQLERAEAPTFAHAQAAFLAAYERGARWTDAAAAVRSELGLVRAGVKGLRALPDRAFARQAEPFVVAAAQHARLGQYAVDLLAAERPALRIRRVRDGFAGSVSPPDADAAAVLRQKIAGKWSLLLSSRLQVYGCRVVTRGCGKPPRNWMDEFLTHVTALDAAWQPTAAAATAVTVSMRGKPIPVGRDGSFSLPPTACSKRVLAEDGAGGETSVLLAPCPRSRRS